MSLFSITNIFSAKNLWKEKRRLSYAGQRILKGAHRRSWWTSVSWGGGVIWKASLLSCQDYGDKRKFMKWSSGSIATSLICFLSLFSLIQVPTLFLSLPNVSFQLWMAFALPFGKLLQNSMPPPPRSPMFLCLSYVCPHVTDKKPQHPELPERTGLPSCQGYDQRATSSSHWYWEGREIKASPF